MAALEAAAARVAVCARDLDDTLLPELERAVTGLGLVDSALTAARIRLVVAGEAAGALEAGGHATTGAWLVDRLGLTGRGAAAEARLAADLADHPDVLASLEAGRISREHAIGIAATIRRQEQNRAAAEAQARADEARRQREQAAADARAQSAADAAERQRLAREAAAEEAARRREAEARLQAMRDEAARLEALRAQQLLDAARDGESADAVRRRGRELADDDAARERREAAQWQRRSLSSWTDRATGMGVIRWELPPELYETVLAGLSAATAPDPADTPEHLRRSPAQRRADAMADLVGLAMTPGDRPRHGGEVPTITVQIPAAALLAEPLLGADGDHERPGIAGHGAELSQAAVRRLGCDAAIVRAITSATGTILDAGRSTRVWSTSQRRAIEARDRGCRFAGCDRPVGFCQIHHVRWWRNGGPTSTDNGVLLCSFHHRAVHHDGWELTYDPVANVATVRRGSDVRRSGPPGRVSHAAVDVDAALRDRVGAQERLLV